MTNWLILILINFLAILGVHKATEEEMIFGGLAKWGGKHLPGWIRKPLYDCPYCMASFWGTPVFWSRYHEMFFTGWLICWVIHVLALCGLAHLVLDLWPKKK